MSRVRGVIRTARLLDEVVKIGVKPDGDKSAPDTAGFEDKPAPDTAGSGGEPDINDAASHNAAAAQSPEGLPPPSKPTKNAKNAGASADIAHGADDAKSAPAAKTSPVPDPALLSRIEELEAEVEKLTAVNAEISAAKGRLEADIDAAKADYESRKKAIEADAASIAAKAENEARERGQSEGYSAGHSEGLAAARAEIQKEYHDKFAALSSAIEGVSAKVEENFAELVELNRPRLLRMWSAMLRRMLNMQVAMNPNNVLNVLTEVLTHLSDKNRIVIYVAPDDVPVIDEGMKGEFQDVVRGVNHLEVKADINVDRGSCIVETDLGVYDARWRTQMEQIDFIIEKLFQSAAGDADGSADTESSADDSVGNTAEAGS